jgi:hypothetical protein
MRPRVDFGSVASAAAVSYAVVAAAGEENDGENDQPYPVVVKQLAQAVVVHGIPPK